MNQTKKAILIGNFSYLATLIDGFDGKYLLEDFSVISGEFAIYNNFISLIFERAGDPVPDIELEIAINKETKFSAYFISENEYLFIEYMLSRHQKLQKLQNQYNEMQKMSLEKVDEFIDKLYKNDIESFYV